MIESVALRHGASSGSIASIFSQQLNEYFDKKKCEYVVFQRSRLVNMVSNMALDLKKKLPTLKNTVRQRLKAYGIRVRYIGGIIEFRKAEALKNPTF